MIRIKPLNRRRVLMGAGAAGAALASASTIIGKASAHPASIKNGASPNAIKHGDPFTMHDPKGNPHRRPVGGPLPNKGRGQKTPPAWSGPGL